MDVFARRQVTPGRDGGAGAGGAAGLDVAPVIADEHALRRRYAQSQARQQHALGVGLGFRQQVRRDQAVRIRCDAERAQ
jgi:hypothetical protein